MDDCAATGRITCRKASHPPTHTGQDTSPSLHTYRVSHPLHTQHKTPLHPYTHTSPHTHTHTHTHIATKKRPHCTPTPTQPHTYTHPHTHVNTHGHKVNTHLH